MLKKTGHFFLVSIIFVGGFFFVFALSIPRTAHAAISFVGSCSANGGNGANATLTLPSMLEGDLVIVAYQNGDDDNGNKDLVMVTAGYTEVADLFSDDSFETNLGVFYKFMGSTPDTEAVADNISGTDSDTPAVCMVFRGVDTGTPFDVTSTTASAANQGTFVTNPPSINHNNPSGVWIVIAGANAHNLGTGTYTFPTGYTTDAVQIVGNDTIDGSVGLGYRSSGVSDPEDPGNMTYSGTDAATFSWAAVTMALRPAPPSTFNQEAYEFFNNANSTDVGSELSSQDNPATLASSGAAFRLRTLLHIGAAPLFSSGQNFKLQFAEQSGTCDTGFSGESYADVTGATAIAYSTANTPADGDNLTSNANDPSAGHTIVHQDYEEANNFTNTAGTIPSGQDGQWDFSLIDNGATADTSYCFRVVESDGTQLDTYTVVPEVITAAFVPVYSVSITSSGVIEYGFVELSTASSTVGNGYTQTAQNDGNTTEQLNVKSSDASGGTAWTLASAIGSNIFKHEFSTTTGSTWTVMPNNATYVTAKPSVAVSGTVDFDFRLTTPSASTDYQQKSITITVQAVAP